MKLEDWMKTIQNIESGSDELIEYPEDVYDYEDVQSAIAEWESMLGEGNKLQCTPFRDEDFVLAFLGAFPDKNEQFKYVKNTNDYHTMSGYKHLREFDGNYVLVTRRSVPSAQAKPEQYWTDEHNVALTIYNEFAPNPGVSNHSVIMVTTLQKLNEHGLGGKLGGAVSDGEICIIDEPFPTENFSFVYKPGGELYQLENYIRQGGKTNREVLEELALAAEKRKMYYKGMGRFERIIN